MADNFISMNSYLGAEINAHSLILIILRLRKDGTPHLLLTWLYSSQPCESFFKSIRSMSPVASSQTSCTLSDFMERAAKVILFSV
jgi:hypothetical protein